MASNNNESVTDEVAEPPQGNPSQDQAEAMAEVAAMAPERETNEVVTVEPEVVDPNGEVVKERFISFLDSL